MRMQDVFDRYLRRKFVYGKSDCCQFVGECIEAQTGKNPAKYFKYAGESAAAKLLEQHGGLEGMVTYVLGEPVEDKVLNGYVALVDKPEVLGIVWRSKIVARTGSDIVDIPLDRGRRFWSPWAI